MILNHNGKQFKKESVIDERIMNMWIKKVWQEMKETTIFKQFIMPELYKPNRYKFELQKKNGEIIKFRRSSPFLKKA